jgi:cytochrome c oxidase subunit 3
MATPRIGSIRVAAASRRTPVVPDGVLGMLIFVSAEAMFFAGLISAFSIIRAGTAVWPPAGQPRLPFEQTALNTAALLASGAFLYWARRRFRLGHAAARRPLLAALALGAFFVVFQGVEWVRLLGQGLTLTSSSLGSFFYLIVGMHAIHAVAALVLVGTAWWRIERGWLARSQLATAEVFWYFVVGVWPVLWLVVYR